VTEQLRPSEGARRARLARVDLLVGTLLVLAAAALFITGLLEVRATIARYGSNVDSGVYHAILAFYLGPIGLLLLIAAFGLRRHRPWGRVAHAGALIWAIAPAAWFLLGALRAR
jgi:hypothetical protein